MMPNVYAVTFARGGSKGVPGKNIRPMNGRPLIAHAIRAAQQVPSVSRIFVSTDSEAIADAARAAGADVPFLRPAALARDDSPEWAAWQHFIHAVAAAGIPPMDVMVSVPTTSPLRSPGDIESCVQQLLRTDSDVVITVTPASRSPYFNMVTVETDGSAHLVISEHQIARRQDAPPVFDVTTVAYAVRPDFVLRANGIFDGKVGAVVVPQERAIDIDTEHDFAIAEYIMARRDAATGTGCRDRG